MVKNYKFAKVALAVCAVVLIVSCIIHFGIPLFSENRHLSKLQVDKQYTGYATINDSKMFYFFKKEDSASMLCIIHIPHINITNIMLF